MTPMHPPWEDSEHWDLWEFLRFYRATSIYSAVMVTLLFIVFILSEVL